MNEPLAPVVLDVDGAVGPLAGEWRIDLKSWQEALRFGCSNATMRAFARHIGDAMPAPGAHGTVLMGSGDFHHLSTPLIERAARSQPGLRVVVLDNHPDNMRFPFGIHCGSWVRRIAMLPQVSEVHVAGITSGDIGSAHAWENRLAPLYAGKLCYWSVDVDVGWSRWLGLGKAFRSFSSIDALVDALAGKLQGEAAPTYLSIDKDAFAPEVVRTNWDQGRMLEAHAMQLIASLQGQIAGSDITGEISTWRYSTWWKRWLSAQDGQDTASVPQDLSQWQAGQHAFNQRLLPAIAAATARVGN